MCEPDCIKYTGGASFTCSNEEEAKALVKRTYEAAVRLAPDAVYYTGKPMPDWVKKDVWIVKSIAGDRAVIDKNISGTSAICSPVHVKYLIEATASGDKAGQALPSGQSGIQEEKIQQEIKASAGDGRLKKNSRGYPFP